MQQEPRAFTLSHLILPWWGDLTTAKVNAACFSSIQLQARLSSNWDAALSAAFVIPVWICCTFTYQSEFRWRKLLYEIFAISLSCMVSQCRYMHLTARPRLNFVFLRRPGNTLKKVQMTVGNNMIWHGWIYWMDLHVSISLAKHLDLVTKFNDIRLPLCYCS